MTDFDFIDKAWEWYKNHTEHVDKLKKDTTWGSNSFAPSREDRNHPELWKPGHWRWFFENYNME